MSDRVPAEVFPPGEFLKEELEERGWSQIDLAEILGRSSQLISEIVLGKRGITPETAKGLAHAFGTSAQYWLNLESAYRLSQVDEDEDVGRRARLYTKAPIKDMIRRNWIEHSDNVTVLERRVLDFFELDSLDQEPDFWEHAARKSTSYSTITPAQMAWLFRAKQLARALYADSFSQIRLNKAIDQLREILHSPEEIRHIPRILANAGVRFLIIEALPGTRIDGACFWLDEKWPVVALSLRYDRIDCFWHTAMHELGHVKRGDGLKNNFVSLDTDLVGEHATPIDDKPKHEKEADCFAVETLVPQGDLENFIVRVRPLYSKVRLKGFANLMKVHPGIVVGQLQHRGEISYAANREMLVKVRHIITESTLTDGWGNVLQL